METITVLFVIGLIISAYALGYRDGARETRKGMAEAFGLRKGKS